MTSQLAKTSTEHINSIEAPAVFFLDEIPIIFWNRERTNDYCTPSSRDSKAELQKLSPYLKQFDLFFQEIPLHLQVVSAGVGLLRCSRNTKKLYC